MDHKLIIVAGMHRSGTSMLARISNLLGAHIGSNLLSVDKSDNPYGYWEDSDIVDLHNNMLARCGLDVNSVSSLPDTLESICDAEIDALHTHITRHYAKHPISIIKDPRVCRFIPQWNALADNLSLDAVFLLPIRNPLEIAYSLKARNEKGENAQISVFEREEYALLWWLIHVLEAEYHTRNQTRYFMRYEEALSDWKRLFSDMGVRYNLDWQDAINTQEEAINQFISPDGYRQKTTLRKLKKIDSMGMAYDAYEALCVLCNNQQNQESFAAKQSLDKIRHHLQNILPFFSACMVAEREAARHLELTRADSALERLTQTTRFEFSTLHHQLGSIQKTYVKDMEQTRKEIEHMRKEMANMEFEYRRLAEEYYTILHKVVKSYSWKVTAPLRYIMNRTIHGIYLVKNAFNKTKVFLRPSVIKHSMEVLRKEGPTGVRRRLRNYYSDPEKGWSEYGRWYAQYMRLNDDDRAQIKKKISNFTRTPTVSIIMPVYNTDRGFLVQAIESVKKQLYPHWELCIVDDASTESHIQDTLKRAHKEDSRIKVKYRSDNGHIARATNDALAMATGEYIAFLDHDDLLSEHALYCMIETLHQYPEAKLIYSDEDKINENGAHIHAHFKPDWNPTLFYSYNYLCHFVMIDATIATNIQCKPHYNGCQDYDFLFSAIKHMDEKNIIHIPEILYHWREYEGSTAQDISAKPYAVENSVAMLKEHIASNGLTAKNVKAHAAAMGAYHVEWAVPADNPRISLIIPTRNKHELVKACIESIRTRAGYNYYDIIIIDNQSDAPEALAYFDKVAQEDNVRVLHFDEPFNYAKMNNWAVDQVDTPYVGFINNDIIFKSDGWLYEMISHFSLPNTGAVGCKLFFPDGRIQHAGVCLRGGYNLEAVAGHYFSGWDGESLGYMGRAVLTQELSAVTAAAMLVDTTIFKEVGGFNAEKLAIAFNDIDLCLKITQHAKRRVIFTPYAQAVHLESASRGYEDTPEKMARFMRETSAMYTMWDDVLRRDPHYNPNLSTYAMDYSLAWPPERKRLWEDENIALSSQTAIAVTEAA